MLSPWSVEGFLSQVSAAAIEIQDPEGHYPDVAAARARQGVELFWPPPRRSALGYFAGFGVTLIAVAGLAPFVPILLLGWFGVRFVRRRRRSTPTIEE